jgi:glyoxylase-like metal-dependent hydrolase (beta-lactamase superfamily II)
MTQIWNLTGQTTYRASAETLARLSQEKWSGWVAPAMLGSQIASKAEIEPIRNKACLGSIPLLILPDGGYLSPEAAQRIALWDSEIIAFAGGGADHPGVSEGPNAQLLLAQGKLLVEGLHPPAQIADGDLLCILPGSERACQALLVRGVAGTWFEVSEVGPGVIAFGEPGHYERAYSYLVLGEERAALLDTGMGIANLQREVTKYTDKPLTVINTHSHYDHVGDNFRFEQIALFETPSSVAAARNGFLHDFIVQMEALAPNAFYRPASLPQDWDPENYIIRPFGITQPLRGGERFDLGGRVLEVIHTPGHSSDSICLLDAKHKLLFTGDAFYPGTMYGHFTDSNFGQYVRSAARMAGYVPQLDYIYPAHNRPALSPRILVEFAQALEEVQAGRAHGEAIEWEIDRGPLSQPSPLALYEWPRFALLLPKDTKG